MQEVTLFNTSLREPPHVLAVLLGLEEKVEVAFACSVEVLGIARLVRRVFSRCQRFALALLLSQQLDGGLVRF